jgi:hypothetical protein
MKFMHVLITTTVALALAGAAPSGSAQTTPAATGGSTAASARDVCALISNAELAGITNLAIERSEKTADGCQWFTAAAARQQRGQDDIRGTLEKMTKQEPSSFEEGLRNMEGLLKGVGGLASSGLLLTASVQWTGGDKAEETLKTTFAMMTAGMPGGKLEPIEGLGDRAYVGPMGSLLYVRKGAAWLELDLRTFPGSRDQAIQIARRLLSKM